MAFQVRAEAPSQALPVLLSWVQVPLRLLQLVCEPCCGGSGI